MGFKSFGEFVFLKEKEFQGKYNQKLTAFKSGWVGT